MHILLTDILTCPRCGPEFGLILLAEDLRDRRIHEGWLGCANCRGQWGVSRGFGRFGGEEVSEGREGAEGITTEGITTEGITTEGITTEGITTEGITAEGITTEGITTEGITTEGFTTEITEITEATRIAALLGVTEGPAYVLIAGPGAQLAAHVADLVEDLEVVAAGAALADEPERPGVSRISVGERLPFYGGRLRGVWLGGAAADRLLEEGARVVGPLGRLVLEPAPADVEERLGAVGLRILARRDDTVVSARMT